MQGEASAKDDSVNQDLKVEVQANAATRQRPRRQTKRKEMVVFDEPEEDELPELKVRSKH